MLKRIASIGDFDKIYKFYDEVIESQKTDKYSAYWTKDVYPSKEDLINHINNNEMFIGLDGDEIASAGVLTYKEDPIYHGGKWTITNDDDICVIHLLAVHPKYRGKGYSNDFIQYLIEIARQNNSKAIHLDVYLGNDRASEMYLKNGFAYRGRIEVYYEDTGNMQADLYEYIL